MLPIIFFGVFFVFGGGWRPVMAMARVTSRLVGRSSFSRATIGTERRVFCLTSRDADHVQDPLTGGAAVLHHAQLTMGLTQPVVPSIHLPRARGMVATMWT